MNIKIEDLMSQVNAEEDEKSILMTYLEDAKAVVKRDINRPITDLNIDELKVFNQIVLEMAACFYVDRKGTDQRKSKSFSSLDSLINILRKPPMG